MAFWGIEVKPGNPFTHNQKRRLHLSQATLGTGSAINKSLVQCNVGNRSPVFLCSLFPEKSESCQLNLEFEEADEVVFSIIGPRSVHLTGYYLADSWCSPPDDESESYGEDIADTDMEMSADGSDEDEYDDSFIDDGDLEVIPPSPPSSDGGVETLVKGKPKNRVSSRRQLRKKYQLSESDDKSESDDVLPISSLFKNTAAVESIGSKAENKEIGETGKKEIIAVEKLMENHVNESERKADVVHNEPKRKNVTKSRNIRKGQLKEEKPLEAGREDDFFFGKILKWDKANQSETKVGKLEESLPVIDERQRAANDRGVEQPYCSLPSTEVVLGNVAKTKKKGKQKARVKKGLEIESLSNSNVILNDKSQKVEAKDEYACHNIQVKHEEKQKQSNDKRFWNSELPSFPSDPEVNTKLKKKRKEWIGEKTVGSVRAKLNSVVEEDKATQDELKSDSMDHDGSMAYEQSQKHASFVTLDNGATIDQCGYKYLHEKNKRKKKRNRTGENGVALSVEVPLTSLDRSNKSFIDRDNNNAVEKSFQPSTMLSGLVIEELEMGNPDGKVAVPGKKISVRYTGKLKESRQVFDANIDGAPLKFRLGGDEVIEGFNIGLDGMRVGEKRRLTIPPSMGYRGEGDGKNVPHNSWLEYDVELVKVH